MTSLTQNLNPKLASPERCLPANLDVYTSNSTHTCRHKEKGTQQARVMSAQETQGSNIHTLEDLQNAAAQFLHMRKTTSRKEHQHNVLGECSTSESLSTATHSACTPSKPPKPAITWGNKLLLHTRRGWMDYNSLVWREYLGMVGG